MALFVLSTGLSKGKDLERLKVHPDFRKATRNMMLSWLALEEALEPVLGPPTRAAFKNTGIVLGSGWGELEVTQNFLKSLADAGVARPILFQNSLHNATLGFLTLQMALTGPSITVSNQCFTGENCLEVAPQLLELGQCDFCIVVGVDARVEGLNEALSGIYSSPIQIGEGAAVLVLANEEGVKRTGLVPLAVLEDVKYLSREDGRSFLLNDYYESNAIEKWIEVLRSSTAQNTGPLVLEKPDGTRSEIYWSRT